MIAFELRRKRNLRGPRDERRGADDTTPVAGACDGRASSSPSYEASVRALTSTASNISSVSVPVKVFCWLTW